MFCKRTLLYVNRALNFNLNFKQASFSTEIDKCSVSLIPSPNYELEPISDHFRNKYELDPSPRIVKAAIIGLPNAGKSTLINQIVGRKVCACSSKVHTTRVRTRAITTKDRTQIVFLDTPGLVSGEEAKKFKLQRSFVIGGEMAIAEADVLGVIHDVNNRYTRHKLDPKILRLLFLYPKKHTFLILNKVDIFKKKQRLLDLTRTLTSSVTELPDQVGESLSERQIWKKCLKERGWKNIKDVFMVSALNGLGIDPIVNYLINHSRSGQWMIPKSEISDQSNETIIIEAVKARILDMLPHEIPYVVKVQMEYYEEMCEGSICAVVLICCPFKRVEKMLLSHKGQRIRHVAHEAEQVLCSAFMTNVHLKLVVTGPIGDSVLKELPKKINAH